MKSGNNGPVAPTPAEIYDRGRGPEIKGTRITVFDVLDFALECWPPERIALALNLRPEQVEAAINYIVKYEIETLKDYVDLLERRAGGNTPEVQARLEADQAKTRELLSRMRAVKERTEAEIQELVRQCREAGKGNAVSTKPAG